MSRPTTRRKEVISLAIIGLREFLGETQAQFAARLGTTTAVVGRYEINYPPGEKVLRQLHAIAVQVGHEPSANVFETFIRLREGLNRLLLRNEQIKSAVNIRAANDVLKSLWKTASSAKQTPAMKRISSDLLKMADLIMLDGERELRGEPAKETNIYTGDPSGPKRDIEFKGKKR